MAGIMEYECPCCGGMVEFDSSIQKLKCPYCDTEFELDALQGYQEDKATEKEDQMTWEKQPNQDWSESEVEGMHMYQCQSCGGEILCDETTAATKCPYCGNNIVIKGQIDGQWRPDYVIPFQLDKEAAKAGFKRHLEGKRLLPNVFKEENHINEIKGIYVPFWLFDAEADAAARYKATRVNVWCDSKYRYTTTSFYSVVREGEIGFSEVPVDGSSRMDDILMESLEPFDFSKAVDFHTAYLAGYFADHYDVDVDASIHRANERIKRSAEDALANTVNGYVSVHPESSSVSLHKGEVKYALYPVWIFNTTWRGKTYTFAMNGQNGKFVGDLPVDKNAYWKWFGKISAISGLVTLGISYLLWLFL